MAKRRDTERRFRQALAADSALSRRYGELHTKMAEVQEQKAALAAELTAFLALDDPRHAAAVLGRALWTYPYLVQRERGVPEEALSQLKEQMLSVAGQPGELQSRLLAARLADFRRYLGDDSQIVQQILKGRTPAAAAQAIVAASVLADSAEAADALAAGSLTLADPALEMVGAFFQRFVAFFFAMQEITEAESEVAIALGRARLAIYGTTIPPDATFSLRIADGVVTGYEYNGTYAPPYTTFYGMYDRYYSFGAGSEWDLPEAWLRPPASFELPTPLNFVFTADATGGNSGSPVVDQDLELVGLMFDGNIESLPGDYIYDPVSNRSVAVDVRGMLEALDEIYDADRLVLELTTGRLLPTEEAADAVLVGQ